jgi:hypothetical protein
VADFMRCIAHVCTRHKPLVEKLVPFVLNEFELGVDPNLLPDHFLNETWDEEQIRLSLIDRITDEFQEKHPEFTRMQDHIVINVLYWRLSKFKRVPSNVRRLKEGKSSSEELEPKRSNMPMSIKRAFATSCLLSVLPQIVPYVHRRPGGDSSTDSSSYSSDLYDDLLEDEPSDDERPGEESLEDELFRVEFFGDEYSGDEADIDEGLTVEERSPECTLAHPVQSETPGLPFLEPELLLPNMFRVDRSKILKHLKLIVSECYRSRYGDFLDSGVGMDLENILECSLCRGVKRVCSTGSFDLRGYD